MINSIGPKDPAYNPLLEDRFQRPENWKESYIEGRDGYALRTGTLKSTFNSKAHVLMAVGLGEFIEKYYELARNIVERGMDFTIYDPAGQGLSDPLLTASNQKPPLQHLDDYNRSIENLVRVCHTLDREVQMNKPVILLGHSTGGLTAKLAAQRHPDLFDALMLTAPLSGGLAHGMLAGNESFFARLPVPGFIRKKGIYHPKTMPVFPGKIKNPDDPEEAHLVRLSNDPVRNKVALKWLAHRKELHKGPATYGWFHEQCKAISECQRQEKHQALALPSVLAIGGKDELVDNLRLYKQGLAMPNCKMIDFPFASHELLMEKDPVRNDLLDALDDLADQVSAPRAMPG